MQIDKLLYYEDNLIISSLEKLGSDKLSDFTIRQVVEKKHREVIGSLIWSFLSAKNKLLSIDDLKPHIPIINSNNCILLDFNTEDIPQLCEQLHINFLNSHFSLHKGGISRKKSKTNFIENGAVYTKPRIASGIVTDTLQLCQHIDSQFSILDFACGTGRFYESIITELEKYGLTPEESVLNNIYAIDIDEVATNITRLKAFSRIGELSLTKISRICSRIIVRNALIKNNSFFNDSNGVCADDFEGRTLAGFDAIVSNPPYLVLKPNKKKLDSNSGNRLMQLVSHFRTSGMYRYAIEGMLNLYQLSIEAMLSMLKKNGVIGVICPSTLFADISATKLRKHLLFSNKITSIQFFGEDAQLFENVQQATCIFGLIKDSHTKQIAIQTGHKKFHVDLDMVKTLFPNNFEIPTIQKQEWNILIKLSKFKKLRDLSFVRNKRGELDLTLFSQYITKEKTSFRLIRGNMIGLGGLKKGKNEYVLESFIDTRSDEYMEHDFQQIRLVCQQVSNANTVKRLKFVFCEPNDILGNSCNYLSSDETTLRKLFLLLNSSILNWRFKVTSSNNHINNYELAELPIVDLPLIDVDFSFGSQAELDYYIGRLYGLTDKEIELITA
ncbi:MAG: N-6 DNA methylase [Muribaculaceae bacterium]|nr:N-6 DNA methylase [Muribaculaceae bacterium]